MRELVIFGRRRGSTQKVLVSGPEVPPAKQRAIFKDFLLTREHAEFELVELTWLDVDRSRKLKQPTAAGIVFEPNAPGGSSREDETAETNQDLAAAQPIVESASDAPATSIPTIAQEAAPAPIPAKRSTKRRPLNQRNPENLEISKQ